MNEAGEGWVEAAEGVRLYFRSVGEGEPVVIPLVDWTREYEALAARRRLISYDPRSRGRSTAVDAGKISFSSDVQDLEALRGHLGLERFSLIGWSYYGGVVARYAMEFPERVRRLAMVCGPPIRRSPHTEAMNRVMLERIGAAAPGFLEAFERDRSPEMLRRMWELVKKTRAGRPLRAMLGNPSVSPNESPEKVSVLIRRAVETQGDWDWRGEAGRIACPVLLVAGGADYLPLEAVREWTRSLKDASLLEMAGVGHFPSLESPEEFFRALEQFFAP
jgi:pimeloyl-ACP methyl ester carboxylesterase